MDAPAEPSRLAQVLCRTWAIERRLEIRSTAQTGMLTGTARWRADDDSPDLLHYSETGTLHLGASELACTRSLAFHLVGDDQTVAVRFADGRPFYTLAIAELLRARAVDVEHLCGADRYRGTVQLGAGALTERWDVSGPHKDYTSTSVLRPATGSGLENGLRRLDTADLP